jgi:hypothetical protein
MEICAAFAEYTDHEIGRLVDAVGDTGCHKMLFEAVGHGSQA